MRTQEFIASFILLAIVSIVASYYANKSDEIYEKCITNVELQICE